MLHNHRRLAVQLASQLPENREDALKTLACLQWLVDGFLYGPRLSLVAPVGPGQAQVPSGLTEAPFGAAGHIPGQPPE